MLARAGQWQTQCIVAMLCSLLLCCSVSAATLFSSPATLFSEDFEDGDAKGWKAQGKGSVAITAYGGNHSISLTQKKSVITALPISGYRDLRVTMAMAADSLEKFDQCFGEISTDGGANWVEVLQLKNGMDDGLTLHTGSINVTLNNVTLNKAALKTAAEPDAKAAEQFLLIRFRAAGKDASDRCWGDNVRVTGVALPQPGAAQTADQRERAALSYQLLTAGHSKPSQAYKRPVMLSAYAPPKTADAPKHSFQGRLNLTVLPATGGFETLRDDYNLAQADAQARKRLPEFSFEFVQTGDHIVPLKRGVIPSKHPGWEFILEPGRAWSQSGDQGYSRAAIPFALQERNANCTHNGVLTFLFKNDGSVSNAAFQISAETCLYFKFNAWGLLRADYQPYSIQQAEQVIQAYHRQRQQRLPTKPIAVLAQDYPDADSSRFGATEEIDPEHMTLFGFVIDGTHYVGGCDTRHGPYPYCDEMTLPSYSTAKSIFAGLALMRMEKKVPSFSQLAVSDYVPECTGSQWQGVKFEHLLDMSTGNYDSAVIDVDEASSHVLNGLFLPEDHASKINYSCGHYPRKAKPGERWVYHSSDTYILGTAMNAAVNTDFKAAIQPENTQSPNQSPDIYTDLVVKEIWRALDLNPTLNTTRRTYDAVAQPFTGWGLSMRRDDIARIAEFLNVNDGVINNTTQEAESLFDNRLFTAAMQRDADDRGLPAPTANFRYNNGFWGHDVKPYLDCPQPTWVPFMSGYGGIILVMLPNGTSYYYFSDGGTHRWSSAALESHRIRGYCQP